MYMRKSFLIPIASLIIFQQLIKDAHKNKLKRKLYLTAKYFSLNEKIPLTL